MGRAPTRVGVRRKEGLVRADRLCHQLLGVRQIARRRQAIVEASGRQDVRAERLVAQHVADPRVGAAALAVPGRREAVTVQSVVLLQGLQQRRP